jgi:hypothetical protein
MSSKMDDHGVYDVVWPRGKSQIGPSDIAPRLKTLAGKKVAQLWDHVFRGDEIYEQLEESLRARYPDVEFVSWRNFGNTHGHDERAIIEGLPKKLKSLGIDAVISGVGACGSCTPAVIRASAVAERAGIPSASLIAEGFVKQAKSTVVGLGLPDLPVAIIPGHLGAYSHEQLREYSNGTILQQVIDNLTRQPVSTAIGRAPEPAATDIVFSGSFEEVNAFFYDNEWSDGLPIVPPTRAKVEAFLRFTELHPNTLLGVLLPDNRAVTVWSVAVNGVMAGCRPEYMPVLVAVAEVLCDPDYGVEHSGNTPGADSLIILNGPVAKQLKFNYEQGVMRDGFQANTTVGRFLRLFLRNLCGFLLHKTDKGCYGNTWRVVVPENDDFVKKIGWEPLCAEMGFEAGDNTVTIARYTGGDVMISATGNTPEEIMPYLADGAARMVSWQVCFTIGATARGMLRPLMILPPVIAEVFARHGWSKGDVKQYLFDHARIPAWRFEKLYKDWTETSPYSLTELVRMGDAPKLFHASDDPNRMLPIVGDADDFQVIVSGDPLRTNVYYFQHNGSIGYPTTKKIKLPATWNEIVTGTRGLASVEG